MPEPLIICPCQGLAKLEPIGLNYRVHCSSCGRITDTATSKEIAMWLWDKGIKAGTLKAFKPF